MATAENTELIDRFEEFYRNYYRNEIGELAQKYPNDQKSLYIDWDDLYRFDPDLADDYRTKPGQLQEFAEEALRLYDLPVDVSLGQAHVRMRNLPDSEDIRDIRHEHHGNLIAVQGIVRKATDVRPKVEEAAFECQRCGTLTRIPQAAGDFQEPHECQGCERQGPFRLNTDQSQFIDAQKIRVQESPEGLRGGETPQSIDINVEDDITGTVTAGDHVRATGILKLDQQGSDQDKSPMFDIYMDGVSIVIEDEQFEDMEITDADKKEIVELSNEPDIYDKMVGAIAPSIYGYEKEKLAMMLQLFSGVTKELPDGSRIRGDLHMLLIGDPGTGKSQLLSYIQNIAPRSVYTSGKGSSSAGLTAAAVRDDFGDGQQWNLEAGALVLADQGIAAIDELDKMSCVTGDTLVHGESGIARIRDLAHDAAETRTVVPPPNGRTIREFGDRRDSTVALDAFHPPTWSEAVLLPSGAIVSPYDTFPVTYAFGLSKVTFSAASRSPLSLILFSMTTSAVEVTDRLPEAVVL
jgi:replicative DNA helicase Mcm